MNFNFHLFKLFIFLLILCSIIPQINSVLSFTYPQATTLKSKNILVIEQNGIHICDSTFNNIIQTLHTFPEEDRITTVSKLSKILIKKSSYVILIISNYKIYIVNTENGALLYYSQNRIIVDEEPEYVDLAYSYNGKSDFYFTVSYLDTNNILQMQYYKFKKTSNFELKSLKSLGSVTRRYNSVNYNFLFKQKGLSCDNLSDEQSSYITCFVIGNFETDDYLLPLTFVAGNTEISFNSDYTMDLIKVNDVTQIKTDTNYDMDNAYVCYTTNDNKATCYNFYFSNSKGNFVKEKDFEKSCRSDIYGMKVNYVFETTEIYFSCSDVDGSLQIYFFENSNTYLKYENCSSIYGCSIIHDSSDYYIASDVICQEGKIPFNLLINSDTFNPEILEIETTNPIVINLESTNIIKNVDNFPTTNELEEKIEESTQETIQIVKAYSTEIHEEVDSNTETTEKIMDNSQETIKFIENSHIDIELETEIFNNECPEMCLECNSQKKCTKCNNVQNYYPIELSPNPISSDLIECINETIKDQKYPDFYFDSNDASFKPCYEKCSTCYGKGDGNNNNCKTCEEGYVLHPDFNNSKDCVPKPDPLYYIQYGQYIVTNSEICPDDFSFLIEEKKKCIDEY